MLGATTCIPIIPGNASIVNRVFSAFLSQLPGSRSDPRPPDIPAWERAREALQTLSELVGDPSIAHRNPRSLLSFSCVTPEVAKSQLESLKFYSKDLEKTYCPLGRDGRPIRKSVPRFINRCQVAYLIVDTPNGSNPVIGSMGTVGE